MRCSAVAGDVKTDEIFEKVEKYFGGIPQRKVPPKPDVIEKPQTAERRAQRKEDKLATPSRARDWLPYAAEDGARSQ